MSTEINTIREILMGQNIAESEARFNRIDQRFDKNEQEFDARMTAQQLAIEKRIAELEHQMNVRLDALTKQMVERFDKIERQMADQHQQLTRHIDTVSANDKRTLGRVLTEMGALLIEQSNTK